MSTVEDIPLLGGLSGEGFCKMSLTTHKYHYRTKSKLVVRVLRAFSENGEVFLRDLRMIAGSALYSVVLPRLDELSSDVREDFPSINVVTSGTRYHPVYGREWTVYTCDPNTSIELKEVGEGESYLGKYTVVVEEEV